MLNFDILPEQASTYAYSVDPLFYTLTAMAVIMTTLIFSALGYMAYKYRYVEGEERLSVPLENVGLEIAWTVIPTIVFLVFFVWGLVLFFNYSTVPEGTLKIDVVAKQWMWKIQHSNGRREVNELHIPIGQPVELIMSSQDVLHDFYVPAFRVKQDVLPGRFTKLWFEATRVGEYHLFCAEYCGTEHSRMIGTVYAMQPDKYAEWLAGGPKQSPTEAGLYLFGQLGCVTCHSGKSGARGPILEGVFGSQVLLNSGESVAADEEYLLESIMEPTVKIVQGFSALMPSFKNQLTIEDTLNLIAYIKSIGSETETVEVAE